MATDSGHIPTVEICQRDYDELIATETKYKLLVKTLADTESYSNIDMLKKIFCEERGMKNE